VTGRRAAAIVELEDESDVLRDCDRRTDEHFPMLDLMEEKTPRSAAADEVRRRLIQMPDSSSNRRRRVRENVRAKKVRPCLVMSDYPAREKLALALLIPHTTTIRGNVEEIRE
jgi:hypothetical protein